MTEPIVDSQALPLTEPQLRLADHEPRGVLKKNLKPLVYLGAALIVILAAFFTGVGKKTPGEKAAARHDPPQPAVQDNTDNNVQELKNQLAAEQQRQAQQTAASMPTDPALANATPAQQVATSVYGPTGQTVPCIPGQPCPQGQNANAQQLSPQQQQAEQLAAKERELAYNSRFASNLVYARQAEEFAGREAVAASESSGASSSSVADDHTSAQTESSLVSSRSAGDQKHAPSFQDSPQRKPEVNIDSAMGQPYILYEGLTMDTVLMNRLDGDAVGPVKVLVSNPIYSHDHQHVLVPDGTIVLGEARKIGASGFGQQRRLAVVFHRMIMPDGYSVDLDQFHGLDHIGEEGLKDKVNNHYLQIFGTSIALGVISGAAQITQGGGTSPPVAHRLSRLAPHPACLNQPQRPWIASSRFRQPSRFGKAIGSRFTSRKTCCCRRTTTTLFRKPSEEMIMRAVVRMTVLIAASAVVPTGCQSHQSKVDALQKEYDRLGAQFQSDCSAEYFKVPPTLSQKCADEKNRSRTRVSVFVMNKPRSKRRHKMKIRLIFAALALASGAQVSQAQFGSGIVYDPTQSAHAAQQILQANQLYTTTVAITRNVIGAYNLAQRMANLPQTLYTTYVNLGRQQWTILTRPVNTYGNSLQWMSAASNGYGAASANQTASMPTVGQILGFRSLSPQGQQMG